MRGALDLLYDRVVALASSGHGRRSAPRKGIHSQKPVNEQRVAAYERVIDADRLIAEARCPCGIKQDAITEALVVADPDDAGIELESDLSLHPRTACSSARRGVAARPAAGLFGPRLRDMWAGARGWPNRGRAHRPPAAPRRASAHLTRTRPRGRSAPDPGFGLPRTPRSRHRDGFN